MLLGRRGDGLCQVTIMMVLRRRKIKDECFGGPGPDGSAAAAAGKQSKDP